MARLPDIRDEEVSASLPVFSKRYYSPVALMTRKILVKGSKAASRILGSVSVPATVNHRSHPGLRVVWKSIESLGRLGVLAKVCYRMPEASSLAPPLRLCGLETSR